MDQSLFGHTMLALASVVTAYTAWKIPNITDQDNAVVVFAASPEQLTEVHWRDPSGSVQLQRDGEALQVIANKTAPTPAATAEMAYPATAQARELMHKLAPLTAVRNLGILPADKLKSMGLDAPKSQLTLHYGATTHTLDVGGTVFGSGDYYARGTDNNTYLLRSDTLSSLAHGALMLQDHDAVGLSRPQFDRVAISAAGKQREITQRHSDDPSKVFFADPAEPDHKLELMSAWLERILRLRVVDSAPAVPQGEPTLRVEFFKNTESVANLQVWPADDKGAPAVSTRFKTPVVLFKGGVEAVLKDLDKALMEGK